MHFKETQIAIHQVSSFFKNQLEVNLNLVPVVGPIILDPQTGLNDHLANEKYQAVSFFAEGLNKKLEVVQSLAKWKRYALTKYEYQNYEGIYVDMKAIRAHEELDNLHSLFVDQWDWELIIQKQDRHLDFLKATVNKIYDAIYKTKTHLKQLYPQLKQTLATEVKFFSSQEFEDLYPGEDFEVITNKITKVYQSVFIMQIGKKLKSNQVFDSRSAEYDDWELNGDLFVWSDAINQAIELSSMGIRVDANSLTKQAKIKDHKNLNPYFEAVLNDQLCQTIGGGIGQSRLIMFLLEKRHLGEVQVSPWDQKNIDQAQKDGIELL